MLANSYYNLGAAITKSDTVNFDGSTTAAGTQPVGAKTCSAIYVGGAGVVAVVFQDGTVVNFTCVAAQILPVAAIRVNSTNTTATLMVALTGN